jgi:hypothetical protein
MSANCRCGCGEQVSRPTLHYRPGHDARRAAAVDRALIAAGGPDPELLAALRSPALRAKAEAMLARGSSKPTSLMHSADAARRAEDRSGNGDDTEESPVESLVEVPAGDSQVQRDAEAVLLAALSTASASC